MDAYPTIEIPQALARCLLHVPISPDSFNLSPPIENEAFALTFPDVYSLFNHDDRVQLVGKYRPYLEQWGRPPIGFMATIEQLLHGLSLNTCIVVVSGGYDPAAEFIIDLAEHRRLLHITYREIEPQSVSKINHGQNHTAVNVSSSFTFEFVCPANVGFCYIGKLGLLDPHADYFYPHWLLDTLLRHLNDDSRILISHSDRDCIRHAINRKYRELYNGRFGVSASQSQNFSILRRRSSLISEVTTILDRLAQRVLVGPISLTHEYDARMSNLPLSELISSGQDSFAYTIVAPKREVTVNGICEKKYIERFPDYYRKEYTTREIRLLKVRHGIVFGRFPTLVGSLDGIVVTDSYGIENIGARVGHRGLHAARFSLQAEGRPYLEIQLSDKLLPEMYTTVVDYISDACYLLQNRWSSVYSHFMMEVCGQVAFWSAHLRPAGVKLLTPLWRGWRAEAFASMEISADQIVPLEAYPSVACREVYMSLSYEFGKCDIIPELLDFTRLSTFIDKGRKRFRRIYAARTDTDNRKLLNEVDLIAKLEERGFFIFIGSQYSVAEQVQMFQEADIVVGKDGSNLTNIMFCQDEAILVEILAEHFFDPLYLRIANLRGMRHYQVLAATYDGSQLSGRDRESIVDVGEVLRTIDSAVEKRRMGV